MPTTLNAAIDLILGAILMKWGIEPALIWYRDRHIKPHLAKVYAKLDERILEVMAAGGAAVSAEIWSAIDESVDTRKWSHWMVDRAMRLVTAKFDPAIAANHAPKQPQ